jgi:4-alpha-glucanotransferase
MWTWFVWIISAVLRQLGTCQQEHSTPGPEPGCQVRVPISSASLRGSWQFAFDGQPDNPYLPVNYVTNTVVYTGTHDNPTTRGWFEDLTGEQHDGIWKYVKGGGARSNEAAHALMELAWSSVAALAIAPLQDLLNLGREARMNVPGRADGNWRWRYTQDMLSDSAFEWLRDLTKRTKRPGTRIAYVSPCVANICL